MRRPRRSRTRRQTLGATAAPRRVPGGPGRRVALLLSVCGMLAANVAVVASSLAPPSSETENTENAAAGDVRALAPPFFALAHAAGALAPWLVAGQASYAARGAATLRRAAH